MASLNQLEKMAELQAQGYTSLQEVGFHTSRFGGPVIMQSQDGSRIVVNSDGSTEPVEDVVNGS